MTYITRNELKQKLNIWLSPHNYNDAAENGLQIEGEKQINKIICATSISLKLIEIAIKEQANTIFVHHGLFWENDKKKLNGIIKERIKKLLNHNINLFAYHLPLDAHKTLGNNAQIIKLLKITEQIKPFGLYENQKIGFIGSLKNSINIEKLLKYITKNISKPNFVFLTKKKTIKKIAICSGAAAKMFNDAINLGADLYITGEASECSQEIANESNVVFIAAGHYATEIFGVKAIAKKIEQTFNINTKFVNITNPV